MRKYNLSSRKRVFCLILLHVSVFLIIGLLIFIRFPCPFKKVVGIPCPACGTLHALEALLRFDFSSYMRFNYLAVPMVIAVWLGIHKNSLFKGSKVIDYLIYIVFVLVLTRYFFEVYLIIA